MWVEEKKKAEVNRKPSLCQPALYSTVSRTKSETTKENHRLCMLAEHATSVSMEEARYYCPLKEAEAVGATSSALWLFARETQYLNGTLAKQTNALWKSS